MTLKKLYIYTLLSFMPCILTAGTEVDFDGRREEVKTSSPEKAGLMAEFKSQAGSGERITAQSASADESSTDGSASDPSVKLEILTEAGELVEVKPIRSGVGASRANFNQYSVRPGTRGKWTLANCSRRPWTLKVDYYSDADYGGHGHYGTPPPPISVSSISVIASTAPVHAMPSPIIFPNLQGGTTYYYWEQFPEFSTMFFQYSAGCGLATNYMYVEVPGLIELPGGNYYYDFNPRESNAYHGDNHYGTQKLIDTLKIVADTYVAAFPTADKLYIYDVSLLRGGIIDANRDWKRPFYGHNTGSDADISKKMVPPENRRKLLEIMCANADTYSEQDVPGEASYFHIRVLKDAAGVPTGKFAGDSKTALKCCKGNEIDPATLEACISTRTTAR